VATDEIERVMMMSKTKLILMMMMMLQWCEGVASTEPTQADARRWLVNLKIARPHHKHIQQHQRCHTSKGSVYDESCCFLRKNISVIGK